MKKSVSFSLCLVALLLLLAGCGRKESRVLDFNGEKVKVTVKLSDGWEADWGETVCYLYPGKNDGTLRVAGWGICMSAEEFAEHSAKITGTHADKYKNVRILKDGSIKCEYGSSGEEGASAYYYNKISDKSYMLIVSQRIPGDDLFSRFDVVLVKQ